RSRLGTRGRVTPDAGAPTRERRPAMTTTTIQSTAGIEGEALEQLRRDIIGRVLVAGDEGYDEARTLHDFSYDRRPAVIVQPIDAHDVAEAVRFARASGLPLAVKSGGHSLAG